jgi:cytochrome c heme-lyase
MGWFWAESSSAPASTTTNDHVPSSARSACPVDHSRFRKKQQDCPAHGRPWNPLNPRNMMPDLPNHPSAANLPTNREISTIPMNERGELWEYPSPQQMLNAMTRKGYDTENPEDVPAMVAVHNFVNEGSWDQVLRWEKKYFP